MQPDRRVLRSSDPSAAIRIFLARNATEPGLSSVVVSDLDGLLIGGVGADDLDVVAALGSVLAEVTTDTNAAVRERVEDDCLRFGVDPRQLHAAPLHVAGTSLVVTSVGAPLRSLDGVRATLARLLAA